MKWFLDLSMRGKLFITFGLLIVLFAVFFVTTYKELTAIHRLQKKIYEVEFANAIALKDARFYQNKIRTDSITMLIEKNRQRLESLRNSGDEFTRKNDDMVRKLFELEKDPKDIAKLKEFDEIRRAFRETRDHEMPLLLAGKSEETKGVLLGIQA